MQSDEPFLVPRRSGKTSDGQSRGVGGQDRARSYDAGRTSDHVLLHVPPLEHRFDDEVAIAKLLEVVGCPDVGVGLYPCPRALRCLEGRIQQYNFDRPGGGDSRDSGPHQPCTDDSQTLDAAGWVARWTAVERLGRPTMNQPR